MRFFSVTNHCLCLISHHAVTGFTHGPSSCVCKESLGNNLERDVGESKERGGDGYESGGTMRSDKDSFLSGLIGRHSGGAA